MKLKSIILFIFTHIRLVFMKMKHRKALNIRGACFISMSTKILVGKGHLSLGKNLVIEHGGYISVSAGGELTIGDNTFVNRNCYIASRKSINIGNNCMIGPNVSIYDHNHKFNKEKIYNNEYSIGEVIIGDNCWIGDGVKILKGAKIGEGSIIGAGVVVSSEIKPHSIVKTGINTISSIK